MLCSLNIQDLAVVESLVLELSNGLTILTGETGAGKSILLTALGLALGDRADSGYIRPGCKRAEINLEFDLCDAVDANQWLIDNQLDDGQYCLVRRVLSEEGRSKAFINNRPVTLQNLQELSNLLVEIHGQHDHLKLLQNTQQRRLLDEFVENRAILEQLVRLHNRWKTTKTELDKLIKQAEENSARQDLLCYQITELEQAGVETLDYPGLLEEHNIQSNLGKILTLGQQQLQQLYENEQSSVNALLGQSITALSELAGLAPEFNEITGLLDDALIQVQESSHILRRRLESLESDPKRLEWLEEKLSILHGLGKKHRTTPEDLLQTLNTLRDELDGIQHGSERIAELHDSVEALIEEYVALAGKLSQNRAKGAKLLEDQISSIIKQLGMPHGELVIKVTTQSNDIPKVEGNDRVEFLVSANPGLPPRPLGKIASGGELSRISLAIQVAATSVKMTPTMIFDEVDSGIGGKVAEIVGQKLRSLGETKQVFCVTHLPQVAAQSHHHLLVEKLSDQDMTHSQVTQLSNEERKLEIARMLGGVKITEQTLAHASEMLLWIENNASSSG